MSKMKAAKQFGAAVARFRNEQDLKQSELAEKAKLHTTFISGVEKGERNVTLETASKIANALDIPLTELFSASGQSDLDTDDEPAEVLFLKLGGTWDMQVTDEGLIGEGGLDDKAFAELETSQDYNETRIAEKLSEHFGNTKPIHNTIGEHLPWAPKINELIQGEFLPLFSGDSSHYRPALIAPALSFIFKRINKNPNVQVIAGLGTDTVDIFLPYVDVFLFDKNGVLPVLFSGANLSYQEKGSDAPKNFYDLARATRLPLLPGAYYVFNHTIYKGGDFVKADPDETPSSLEGQLTFFAPHRTHARIGFLGEGTIKRDNKKNTPKTIPEYSTKELFDTMNSVITVDLDGMNDMDAAIERILSPKYKGVVVVSHASGNAPFPIRRAVIEAVKKGKLVINVSRCINSLTNERYYMSLSNLEERELKGRKEHVVNGGYLNNRAAKAILTRALLEKLGQKETQELVEAYSARTF